MYLGIDIGTSGAKTLLMRGDGSVVAQETAPLTVSRPHPLWAEQDPEDWWAATDDAVQRLDAKLRAEVKSIGLSGQMHGAVTLDKADKVLRPAILWNDGRAGPQCVELVEREPRMEEITGNAVFANFTAPKLLWLREEEPDVFAATRTVLLPKDWLRLRISGEKMSEMSDASGTCWLDVGRRAWSPAMLAACGLDETAMPRLIEGSAPSADLSAEVAARWGMKRVPIAGGGGDNAAGAVGLGVVRPRQTFLSLGTSGVVFTVTDGFRPDPASGVHAFAHAVPDTWHRMSVMLSAASCLDWAAKLTGAADVSALLKRAGEADERSDVIFLPYLSGERTPHADPDARGVLFGMTNATGPAEIARAVLEGVAMGLRDGLDALGADDIGDIVMAGGGSRSADWGRIIAATLNRPLVWQQDGEIGPALGAARLAQLAVGDGDIATVCAPRAETARIDPDPALVDRMAERQPVYRALYPALRDLWGTTEADRGGARETR